MSGDPHPALRALVEQWRRESLSFGATGQFMDVAVCQSLQRCADELERAVLAAGVRPPETSLGAKAIVEQLTEALRLLMEAGRCNRPPASTTFRPKPRS